MKPTREQIEHRAVEILLNNKGSSCWICRRRRLSERCLDHPCAKEVLETCLEQAEKELSKPQLTEDEKVILRNLDKKYKWIARSEDGNTVVGFSRPEYNTEVLHNTREWCIYPFSHLFQFIDCDEEYEIEELLNE